MGLMHRTIIGTAFNARCKHTVRTIPRFRKFGTATAAKIRRGASVIIMSITIRLIANRANLIITLRTIAIRQISTTTTAGRRRFTSYFVMQKANRMLANGTFSDSTSLRTRAGLFIQFGVATTAMFNRRTIMCRMDRTPRLFALRTRIIVTNGAIRIRRRCRRTTGTWARMRMTMDAAILQTANGADIPFTIRTYPLRWIFRTTAFASDFRTGTRVMMAVLTKTRRFVIVIMLHAILVTTDRTRRKNTFKRTTSIISPIIPPCCRIINPMLIGITRPTPMPVTITRLASTSGTIRTNPTN